MDKKKAFSSDDMLKVLNACYSQAVKGIKNVSPPIERLADDYLKKSPNVEATAKKMLNYQVAKCATSGFITGFGGLITMPVTIPANLSSVLYVQMRMIAATAYMGGYDLNDDQIQTFVYVCLAGVSITELIKKAGVNITNKLALKGLEKLPGKILTKINQKVGFRLVTKFGEKGAINLVKVVPVAGAVVNAGFDFAETKAIANRAYKMFIEGEYTAPADEDEAKLVSDTSTDGVVDNGILDSDEALRILAESEV